MITGIVWLGRNTDFQRVTVGYLWRKWEHRARTPLRSPNCPCWRCGCMICDMTSCGWGYLWRSSCAGEPEPHDNYPHFICNVRGRLIVARTPRLLIADQPVQPETDADPCLLCGSGFWRTHFVWKTSGTLTPMCYAVKGRMRAQSEEAPALCFKSKSSANQGLHIAGVVELYWEGWNDDVSIGWPLQVIL